MYLCFFRFPFHNSSLSPCYAPLAMLYDSLEFPARGFRPFSAGNCPPGSFPGAPNPALSHTVGARLPPPLFRPLHIRLNIRRDFCLDHAVIESRIMVMPPIVLFFRNLSGPELLFFFRPGHQPRIQFRCFHLPYFLRKGCSLCFVYTPIAQPLRKSASSEEREKIRFRDRLRKRIASRMMNVLKAGFGEGTPQQVSDRRRKKRGSGFL